MTFLSKIILFSIFLFTSHTIIKTKTFNLPSNQLANQIGTLITNNMAINIVYNLDLYRLPLSEILQNHRKFYGMRRDHGEPMSRWLKRIQRYANRCEFSPITAEFLTIDQFLCGLNRAELQTIQSVNKSWTLKQLMDYVSSECDETFGYSEADSEANDTVNQSQNIAIEVVKPEPIEDDPFSDLVDESNVSDQTDEEYDPEYGPQNGMEWSNGSSTPAGFGSQGRVASYKTPSCSSERSQSKGECFQRKENVKTPVPAHCVHTAAPNFSKFKTTFAAAERKQLREMGSNKTEDSTFILHVVKFLYKNDFEKISRISVSGRSKEKQKEKMQLEYYHIVKNMFRDRLKSLRLDAEEFVFREKKLNQLINNAFNSLSRQKKRSMDV